MVRHDDECVQEELSLGAVVEDGFHEEFRRGCDLKEAAAFGCHSGDQICPSLLGGESHVGSISEKPVAKATLIASLRSGA
jgi:hypothetical protein